MRRLIISLLLATGALTLLSGCFWPGAARHNANHWQVLEADLGYLHENFDWFWKMDRPTTLHLSHNYWRLHDNP